MMTFSAQSGDRSGIPYGAAALIQHSRRQDASCGDKHLPLAGRVARGETAAQGGDGPAQVLIGLPRACTLRR
jgi:hypothetical protein